MRALTLRVLLFVLSFAIFVATGEIALRIIYRDAGRTTLGGPGGRNFEHLAVDDNMQRGRFEYGAKRPGVPRVMVIGDSITWGQGVRDWRDTWTEQLATAMERHGTPHEWAVLAVPGRDIVSHVEEMRRWVSDIEPDIMIYQWYVNDIEIANNRPNHQRWWQQGRSHLWLRQHSFLYFFLDDRFTRLLPPPDRSYADYILQDFIPGSLEWAEFERHFHELMSRAKEVTSRRLMVLYPQVPFRGKYPLEPIHNRLHAMAGPHRLSVPPGVWVRRGGQIGYREDARWRQVLNVAARQSGPLFDTREYFFLSGTTQLLLTISTDDPTAPATGMIELLDPSSHEPIGPPLVWSTSGTGWHDVKLTANVPAARGQPFQLRFSSSGGGAFSIASIDMAVDYGLEIVDLTEPLNTFDTHASIFDAHPNEQAHRVLAEKVLEVLIKPTNRD